MVKWMLLLLVVSPLVFAEKVLVYDEEKGIIFVDKDAKQEKPEKVEKPAERQREPSPVVPSVKKKVVPAGLQKAKGPADIHVKREKDPPELYFKSGLEYYKSGDYLSALKNFKYAADCDVKPEYLLWLGKTYRQLDPQIDKRVQFFNIMERILAEFPESDVADDTLFEMAFYYQKNDDYDNAIKKYKQLIEQYPFGVSYSNHDEFLDIARTQMQMMRGEIISSLKLLGISADNVESGCLLVQRKHNLKETGKADQATVRAIKTLYDEKLKQDELQTAAQKSIREGVRWAVILGAVILVTCLGIIMARVRIVQSQKQLLVLKEMVSDLH